MLENALVPPVNSTAYENIVGPTNTEFVVLVTSPLEVTLGENASKDGIWKVSPTA